MSPLHPTIGNCVSLFLLLLGLFARAKRSSRASCSSCWEKGRGNRQIGHSNYKEGQLRNCRAMRLPTEYGLSLYHFLCTMANSSTVFPRERRGGGRRRKERRMRKKRSHAEEEKKKRKAGGGDPTKKREQNDSLSHFFLAQNIP